MQRAVAAAAIDCGCNVAFHHKISENSDDIGAVFTKLPPKRRSVFQKAKSEFASLMQRARD
jgi:hypothetical protein